eukprot:jgi/Mesvir1/28899/Mv17987-RA.1
MQTPGVFMVWEGLRVPLSGRFQVLLLGAVLSSLLLSGAQATVTATEPHLAGLPWSFTPEQLKRFTCPPGAYLDDSPTPLAEKERRLQGWVQQLLRQGYQVMPGWEVATQLSGGSFWTFSDPMWPKPARCRPMWGDVAAIFNACLATYNGRIALNRRYRVLLRLVTKAASTSIIQTAKKMLDATFDYHFFSQGRMMPRTNACSRNVLPHDPGKVEDHGSADNPGYKLVGTVRDPLARFLSGFAMWEARVPKRNMTTLGKFLDVLKQGFDCGDYMWGARNWTVKGWGHFIPAVDFFRLPYHLYSPTSTPPYIDKLFRMERLDDDVIPYLRSLQEFGPVDLAEAASGVEYRNITVLPHQNRVYHGPMSRLLTGTMTKEPSLMQTFCRAFIQDYICFDYELPEACREMLIFSN